MEFVAGAASVGGSDFPEYIDRYLGELPINLRQRMSYAFGMALPFDTYLFDGVFAVGDPEFRKVCLDLFEARAASAGYILTTRNLHVAKRFGDCGAIIKDGNIEVFDDINDLLERA